MRRATDWLASSMNSSTRWFESFCSYVQVSQGMPPLSRAKQSFTVSSRSEPLPNLGLHPIVTNAVQLNRFIPGFLSYSAAVLF
jgi:hypothetical protein